MATYIVGDLHGCFDQLIDLLESVNFCERKDQLLLTGDIVARGPKSLESLLFLKSMKDSANFVLGNHDLNLIAIAKGIRKPNKSDKLEQVLKYKDLDKLIEWLQSKKILIQHPTHNFSIVHAGIPPGFNLNELINISKKIEDKISSRDSYFFLKDAFFKTANVWSPDLKPIYKELFMLNAFTRIRYVNSKKNEIDYSVKCHPIDNDNPNIKPWFELIKTPDLNGKKIIFGHWSSLMGVVNKNVLGLDTGSVWGNYLTMIRWEDQMIFKSSLNSIHNKKI